MTDWESLSAEYRRIALEHALRDTPPGHPRHEINRAFAEQRLTEGKELSAYFARDYGHRPLRIADIGAGGGGVALGLAHHGHFVVAVDVIVVPSLRELRRRTGLPLRYVIAAAEALPFRGGVFDAALCLETLEHLRRRREAGAEMMRILRPEGQVMLKTPARLRYLVTPDPHFGIRGLLLLPDRLQKIIVERWLGWGTYDVEHTYWLARSVSRLFPGRGRVELLVNAPWPPPPRRSWPAWRTLLRHHLRKRLRRILWDRLAIYKAPR